MTTELMALPPRQDLDRPLYIVAVNPSLSGGNTLFVSITRMDGLPPTDQHGQALRQDRENWVDGSKALAQLASILDRVPTYNER